MGFREREVVRLASHNARITEAAKKIVDGLNVKPLSPGKRIAIEGVRRLQGMQCSNTIAIQRDGNVFVLRQGAAETYSVHDDGTFRLLSSDKVSA